MDTNIITNANDTIKKATDYTVRMVQVSEIFADPEFNCRGYIAPIDVAELARDIKANGLQIPIVVQPYVCDNPNVKYRIVAGHRRHKAFMINEEIQIPAFIRNGLDEVSARLMNLSENIARKAMNIGQEAAALAKLKHFGLTEAAVAEKLNVTRSWVHTRFNLLDLPDEVQKEIVSGALPTALILDCYTIKKRGGEKEEMYDLVKKYKDAKGQGKRGTPVQRVSGQRGKPSKRQRNRAEIFHLQSVIRETFGNGLTTKCLAWAAGEIDDLALLTVAKEVAEKNGANFNIPDDNCVSSIPVIE